VDPSGTYVYAANYASNDVSQYTIGAGGGLTPMAVPSASAGGGPVSITVVTGP
jgi:6-phosphogluconolactonase (cycloisomerase 2 family)